MSASLPSTRVDKLLALFAAKQFEQLESAARHCTRRHPAAAIGWQMLGVSFLARQRERDALPHLRQALSLAPGDASIHDNLGLVLERLGRHGAAERHFEQALHSNPRQLSAWVNWSHSALRNGHPGRAEHCARQALALAPRAPEAHLNLGNALADQDRWEEAERHFRTAMLCAAPGWIDPALNLGNLFDRQSRFADAVACLEALSRAPTADWRVFSALGRAHSMLGDTAAARQAYARALALDPRPATFSGYLYHLMHDPEASAEFVFAEHCRFGKAVEAGPRGRAPGPHANDRDPERPLRIGFVSADLRRHAVAHFMQPMFEALGQQGLTLVAYSNLGREDEVSARLRTLVHTWHPVAHMSDAEVAELVRADRIDILVDLSGHTAENRLPLFALKPAPLQVTWLGYSGTTGMRSMDYRFVYTLTAPPGRLDDQFTEKLVHLPYANSFRTEPDAPAVSPLPALARGHLTFGSFNRPNKINPRSIALWARVLHALPDARMLVGAISESATAEPLLARFAAAGIPAERLDLRPRMDILDYLALHNEVDVLLDTAPYAGGTTSNHALWMGVPTVTLVGPTFAQRLGAGIMGKAGLSDWVAESEDEFVAIARRAAGDLEALAALRRSLRERLLHSPDLGSARVAGSVALAFRLMWRTWCAGRAPEPLILPR